MSCLVTSPLKFYRQALVVSGCFTLVFASNTADAQSGTRVQPRPVNRAPQSSTNRSTTTQGSTNRAPSANTGLALEGYCPVCIVEMKKWVKGAPTVRATYDGKTYYFPGEEQRQMFLADPAKYAAIAASRRPTSTGDASGTRN